MIRAAFASSAVGGERLRECFAAVVDAAHKHEFLFAADQDRALQVTHIEEKKCVIGEKFRDTRIQKR